MPGRHKDCRLSILEYRSGSLLLSMEPMGLLRSSCPLEQLICRSPTFWIESGDGIMYASVPFMLLALTGVIQP
jgi:hypothetical protein